MIVLTSSATNKRFTTSHSMSRVRSATIFICLYNHMAADIYRGRHRRNAYFLGSQKVGVYKVKGQDVHLAYLSTSSNRIGTCKPILGYIIISRIVQNSVLCMQQTDSRNYNQVPKYKTALMITIIIRPFPTISLIPTMWHWIHHSTSLQLKKRRLFNYKNT